MLKFTLIAGVAGLVIGWTAGNWAIMQPWWPISISGQPEVVLSGKLVLSPAGSEVGLAVEGTANNRKFVDASQVPGKLVRRLIGRPISLRGVASSTGTTDFILITRIGPGNLWAK